MDLILISADPSEGLLAESAGVDIIMVDLEILGKAQRQKNKNTVISEHKIIDVIEMNKVLSKSKLMVRINPISSNSKLEIDQVLSAGADALMLPMFRTVLEVDQFINYVNGRAECHLLLETGAALARIDDIAECNGISSIHIGLNDLHLELKLSFMFELLSGGLVDFACSRLKKAGIKFGFGGIGRVDGDSLISPEIILREHIRLGSSQVILSRDFRKINKNLDKFDMIQSVATLKKLIIVLEKEIIMNQNIGPYESMKIAVNNAMKRIDF
jgi:hypothetical protein